MARDVGLVYSGGHVGLMGLLADAVLEGGGEVLGHPERLHAEAINAGPGNSREPSGRH